MLPTFGGDILQFLSSGFYRRTAVRLPVNGRDVLIVNDPDEIRKAFSSSVDAFPKSDLMIAALEPLLGDGILISNGADWRKQRRMLEPALEQMRVRRLYPLMSETITEFVQRLRSLPQDTEIALDSEISAAALDVIFRTIFTRPLGVHETDEIAAAFRDYQDKAPQDALTVLFGSAAVPSIPEGELAAIAARIRGTIAALIDERLSLPPLEPPPDDILQAVINARDPEDGYAFSREELINQITVLFLAGHETSASALTWCIFILSQQPELAEQIRQEAIALAGDRPLTQEDVNKIPAARNVFRETLRLYPPAGFMTRVAVKPANIAGYDIDAGSLIVLSPWLLHRHHKYWKDPDIFDPDRFSPEREREIVAGAYIPFGLGARVCTGRTLAMIEGPLMIAELMRGLRFTAVHPETVMPVFRLTVRPNDIICCRVSTLSPAT